MSSKKFYLFMVELFWFVEHHGSETVMCYGYRNRKKWEHRYVEKFKENIYGEPIR